MIFDELEHGCVGDLVDVERKSPHRDPDHGLGMIEKLDGFGVKRKIVGVFVVKEMNGVLVQLQRERFEEGNVISEDFFVRKVEFVNDDGIDVVVAQQVIKRSFVANILEEDVERLQKLDADELGTLLLHVVQEELEHVLRMKSTLEISNMGGPPE